jgi:hypothetical protein
VSTKKRGIKRGQVAQVVERSPEKAGVGGSTPSLATIFSKNLHDLAEIIPPKVLPKIKKQARAHCSLALLLRSWRQ